MGSQKAKKLNITKVREQADKYDETSIITFFEEDETYEVVFHPYFSEDRIVSLFESFQDDIQGFEKYKIDIDEGLIYYFMLYHAVLEFTDIGRIQRKNYKKEENYYKASAEYFSAMMKTTYFKEIVASFLEDEIAKVYDGAFRIMESSAKLQSQVAEAQKEISNLDVKSTAMKQRMKAKDEDNKRIANVLNNVEDIMNT